MALNKPSSCKDAKIPSSCMTGNVTRPTKAGKNLFGKA